MEFRRVSPEGAGAVSSESRGLDVFPFLIFAYIAVNGVFNFTPRVEVFYFSAIVMAAACVYMVFSGRTRAFSGLSDPLSWWGPAWCFLVCLSVLWAVSASAAMHSWMAYAGSFFLFVSVRGYCRANPSGSKERDTLARAVGYGGGLISILSIEMASTGIFRGIMFSELAPVFGFNRFSAEFGLWVEGVRMQSLMGLPNLYATFAAICFFVLLQTIAKAGNEAKGLQLAAVTINGAGLLLSGSRGGILAFLAASMAYVAFSGRGRRKLAFLEGLVLTAWSAAAYVIIVQWMGKGSFEIWIAVAFLLYIPSFGWKHARPGLIRFSKSRLFMPVISVSMALVAVVLILVFFVPAVGGLVPESVSSRVIGAQADSNVLQRTVYWQDGLRLFAQEPFTGLGGGAFETLSGSVSDFHYFTKHTHNFYIQVLLENGILGFVVSMLTLVYAAISLIKAPMDDIERAGIAGALAVVAAHSMVEASLHNHLNVNLFFVILGMLSANAAPRHAKRVSRSNEVSKALISSLAVIVIALLAGSIVTPVYVQAAERQGTEAAFESYRWAVITDPINASSYKSRGLVSFLASPESGAEDLAERFAADLGSNLRDPADCFVLGRYYLRLGDAERAVWFFERRVRLERLNPQVWDDVLAQYMIALRDIDEDGAAVLRGSLRRLEEYLGEVNAAAAVPVEPNPGLMGMFGNSEFGMRNEG